MSTVIESSWENTRLKEEIESLRQQLAECQAALIEAHELIRLRRNVFVSETYNERCEKSLAIQPGTEALEKWLGEPVGRLLRYIGNDPYPAGMKPIARTWEELEAGTYPDTWEEVAPIYAKPKGLK